MRQSDFNKELIAKAIKMISHSNLPYSKIKISLKDSKEEVQCTEAPESKPECGKYELLQKNQQKTPE